MSEDEMRLAIIGAMPLNRMADLALRARAGHLTNLELLALAVLRGGPHGEEAVPALLDEAMAMYSHGSYRVPVRVVADFKRAKIMMTMPELSTEEDCQRSGEEVRRFFDNPQSSVLMARAGARIDIYECAQNEALSVDIRTHKEDAANG